ncbi:uncharacterized protein N0V89_010225 [Didymosphaeria variabile]|uniref:Uncharacterized protein n=1 Tax=Didymosphaeria variabile TaxID=1932322 RepID=A0A9W8XGL8_9PLEO|nr:uncharacterized protein N0V89_010225 [Didymosphaeria variabile]KAJ4348846.1 hypothetical protein N0V89_010225 [Didymosphaeria variabile]
MADILHQNSSHYYEPAKRQISIDEDYSDCDEMSQSNNPNLVTPPDDMEGIMTQLSQLTMNAQGPQDQLQSQAPAQSISEAVLAANWVRIFEHHHPTQKHVLNPYRDSDKQMTSFIRSWFAFSELKGFLHLDSLVNAMSTTMEPGSDVEDPRKKYTSFEQWYGDAEKPPGWIFDGETESLVLYSRWLASKGLGAQIAEQGPGAGVEQIGTQTQTDDVEGQDAGLSDQLQRMQIDDMMLD